MITFYICLGAGRRQYWQYTKSTLVITPLKKGNRDTVACEVSSLRTEHKSTLVNSWAWTCSHVTPFKYWHQKRRSECPYYGVGHILEEEMDVSKTQTTDLENADLEKPSGVHPSRLHWWIRYLNSEPTQAFQILNSFTRSKNTAKGVPFSKKKNHWLHSRNY